MEEILSYLCAHAHHAHWLMFFLLLLTALNLPISEDVMLIGGGAIASSCIPEHAVRLYLWLFMGCYLSAWEAYWIGRLLGPRLYQVQLFSKIITRERMEWLRHYYAKFGVYTFIVGRFFPGGFRNALFLSSGLTKMPFHLFIMRDGLACLISSFTLFQIGYHFAQNLGNLISYFEHYSLLFLCVIGGLLAVGVGIYYFKRQAQK